MAETAAVYSTDCWSRGRLDGHTGIISDDVLGRRLGFHYTGKSCHCVLWVAVRYSQGPRLLRVDPIWVQTPFTGYPHDYARP